MQRHATRRNLSETERPLRNPEFPHQPADTKTDLHLLQRLFQTNSWRASGNCFEEVADFLWVEQMLQGAEEEKTLRGYADTKVEPTDAGQPNEEI